MKKKKKKSNILDAVPKPEEIKITVQELPRFEDDEEFPDLASAKSNSDKASNPGQNKILYYNQVTRSQLESSMNGTLSVTESSSTAPDVDQKPVQILRKESAGVKVPRSAQKKTMEAPKKSSKKSETPVTLDFGNMLAVLEQRQQEKTTKQTPKPIVFTVGGALVPKDSTTSKRQPQHLNRDKMPHNPLDSSAPLVKRGKQREIPKAKKPTPLKKIILKEREERKQRRLLEEKGLIPPCCSIAPHQELDSEENTNTDTENIKAELNDSTEDLVNFTSSPSEENLQSISDTQKTSEETNTADVLVNPNRPKIHSRRFREYCSQVLSKDVDSCVTDLLKELVRFQDRLYQKDPIKAKKKRRIVMGLREVLKHLKLKRLKCIIISPNCEKIQSRGGLDDALHNIISIACEQEIPFVFALNRKALGQCVNKPVPVSVLGIFSYDGAENQFHQMVEITEEARKAYQEMLDALQQELEADEEKGDSEEQPLISSESSTIHFNNVTSQPFSEADEPEYVTTWRNLLKNQCDPSL
uniref:Selenocysteine insertion sequence-binding protein 2 n=1 Tax=Callorhinchus milii TaxID=7868 RepID=V9KDP1_CALMI